MRLVAGMQGEHEGSNPWKSKFLVLFLDNTPRLSYICTYDVQILPTGRYTIEVLDVFIRRDD